MASHLKAIQDVIQKDVTEGFRDLHADTAAAIRAMLDRIDSGLGGLVTSLDVKVAEVHVAHFAREKTPPSIMGMGYAWMRRMVDLRD